jgi:phosphohistidine phosphatase
VKLIFIRHGQATAYCADDAGRNLTEFGQAQAHETAGYIAGGHDVDLIVASPFNRAYQTAQILQATLENRSKTVELITLDSITPDDSPNQGLDDLDKLLQAKNIGDNACVAVVCHMPIVARMVSVLTALPPVSFDLAGVAVLETPIVAPDLAQEITRFAPKQP